MKAKWTIKDLNRMKGEGKIRDFKVIEHKPISSEGGRKLTRHWQKRSKEKDWISWNLMFFCNQHAVLLEEEYNFHPDRGWRFDYAIPSRKIAIEYEGGIFIRDGNKGHRSATGIMRDIEKYNAAQSLGWVVIRVAAHNYRTLLTELKKYIA